MWNPLLWNMSCPLATFLPLLFSATHSYTPASSGRKYGISRSPVEWLILILPGSGFPSAFLQEMEGTGLQKQSQGHTDYKNGCHVCLFIVAFSQIFPNHHIVQDTYFPKAKHSSFTDDPLETWRVSGKWTSIFGSYSPITTTRKTRTKFTLKHKRTLILYLNLKLHPRSWKVVTVCKL